jgi:hypothetical protein
MPDRDLLFVGSGRLGVESVRHNSHGLTAIVPPLGLSRMGLGPPRVLFVTSGFLRSVGVEAGDAGSTGLALHGTESRSPEGVHRVPDEVDAAPSGRSRDIGVTRPLGDAAEELPPTSEMFVLGQTR